MASKCVTVLGLSLVLRKWPGGSLGAKEVRGGNTLENSLNVSRPAFIVRRPEKGHLLAMKARPSDLSVRQGERSRNTPMGGEEPLRVLTGQR